MPAEHSSSLMTLRLPPVMYNAQPKHRELTSLQPNTILPSLFWPLILQPITNAASTLLRTLATLHPLRKQAKQFLNECQIS
jgi:hypothetical protein